MNAKFNHLYAKIFQLDQPCDTRSVKWYKNIDNRQTQFLSPDQARARWMLFKEKWILKDSE